MKALCAALVACGLAAATALPVSLRAQQGDTLVLSLERALAIARRSNPAYRRAVHDLGLNAAETRATWAREILPRLDVNLTTGFTGNRSPRATDNFGNPIENPKAPEYNYFSSTRQGFGLSWQLQGPSPWARLRRQQAANDGRRTAEEVAGEALRMDVRRRFFDALEQDELLGAEQAVADASRSDRETAERLFELALKTRVDVLQAELSTQLQELAVRRQVGRRDQARLALRTALGDPDLPPILPESTDPPVLDPTTLNAEALVRRALELSRAVREQEASLRQADARVSAAHGAYWPTLTAGWNVGRLAQGQQSQGLFSFGGFGGSLYSTFGVQMTVPFLGDLTGSRWQVAQAEVQRENARAFVRQARLEAEQGARAALVALRDHWESLALAERSVSIAGEALELAREEYRLGSRTFEQLQPQVKVEADARRQWITARYGLVDALLDLEGAVGGPVR